MILKRATSDGAVSAARSGEKPGRIFAHSCKDGWLIAISVLELMLIVYPTCYSSSLAWPALLALGAAGVFLNCTNYQCVAHNFLHNPFFEPKGLNVFFSVFNTLALGVPQTLYREHHLNHHQYNNLFGTSRQGLVADMSSIYRYSRTPGAPENIWRYAIVGPARADFRFFIVKALKHGYGPRLTAESVALAAFWAALLLSNVRGFVLFYLPIWYLGQVAAYAENYLEHYKAIRGNRLADSVSCYGKLYNFIWFRNGYHQEHHCRPEIHWTQIAEVRETMLPDSDRRVVKWAHWFNF